MKRLWGFFFLLVVLFGSGCSSASELGLDPAKIDVILHTEPTQAAAGVPTTLQAELTGIPEQSKMQVDFELRPQKEGAKSKYINAKKVEPSVYAAEVTFEEKGLYSIYFHLYSAEAHIIKMKELQVE